MCLGESKKQEPLLHTFPSPVTCRILSETKVEAANRHWQLLCGAINKAITSFWSISLRVTASEASAWEWQFFMTHNLHPFPLPPSASLPFQTLANFRVVWPKSMPQNWVCVCARHLCKSFWCLLGNWNALAISFLAMTTKREGEREKRRGRSRLTVWPAEPSKWWPTIKWQNTHLHSCRN